MYLLNCFKLNNQSTFSMEHNNPKILNLFGYSGLASLHAASCGASVTHVDASKKENAAQRLNMSQNNTTKQENIDQRLNRLREALIENLEIVNEEIKKEKGFGVGPVTKCTKST